MGVFSQRIRDERIKSGKKQADLAEYLGTSIPNYSAYENKREPSYAVLCKLADYYGVTTDYLLGRVDYKENIQDTLKSAFSLYANKLERLENIDHEAAVRASAVLDAAYCFLLTLFDGEDLTTSGLYKYDLTAEHYYKIFVDLLNNLFDIASDYEVKLTEFIDTDEQAKAENRHIILLQYSQYFQEKLTNILSKLLYYHDYKKEHLRIKMGLRQHEDVEES